MKKVLIKNLRKGPRAGRNKRVLPNRRYQMVGTERGVERAKKYYYGAKNDKKREKRKS